MSILLSIILIGTVLQDEIIFGYVVLRVFKYLPAWKILEKECSIFFADI